MSGRNIGPQVRGRQSFASNTPYILLFLKYAVFEPGTRNTGQSLVGKNIANPVAMLNASADLLDYLGLFHHGKLIRDAIDKTINVDKIHTPGKGVLVR